MLGNAAADAIRVRYGTNYTVGSTAETLCKNFPVLWVRLSFIVNPFFRFQFGKQSWLLKRSPWHWCFLHNRVSRYWYVVHAMDATGFSLIFIDIFSMCRTLWIRSSSWSDSAKFSGDVWWCEGYRPRMPSDRLLELNVCVKALYYFGSSIATNEIKRWALTIRNFYLSQSNVQ